MISMLTSARRSLEISLEADELENEFGRSAALEAIGARILKADRHERRRLYRLHDELTRRASSDDEPYPVIAADAVGERAAA